MKYDQVYVRIARHFLLASFLLGAAGAAAIAAASDRPCSRCATALKLNAAQWRCLEEQVDYYSARRIDPIRISTVGCEVPGSRIIELPDTRVDQSKNRRSPPAATRPIRPLVVTLSRGQVHCLRNRILARGRQAPLPGRKIDLVAICGPAVIRPSS